MSKLHESLTADRVLEAAKDCMFGTANIGFCEACGAERDGCEPDARNYECEDCGERKVFGAEETFMMLV